MSNNTGTLGRDQYAPGVTESVTSARIVTEIGQKNAQCVQGHIRLVNISAELMGATKERGSYIFMWLHDVLIVKVIIKSISFDTRLDKEPKYKLVKIKLLEISNH